MSQEQILFDHPDGVRVSTARAYLGGRTYAMANVTSVNLTRTPAKRSFGGWMLALGAFVLLIALGAGEPEAFLAAGVALLIGFIGWKTPKDSYHVHLGSASGETEALTSTDYDFVKDIVDALNDAIIRRG